MVQPPYPFPLKPWSIYRGDDSRYPITDGIGYIDANDQPVFTSMEDLTLLGDTWTCQIRRSSEATPIDVDVNADDAATGVLLLALSGALTAPMSKRANVTSAIEPDYFCDVQVSGGDISPRTIYRFDVWLTGDVTQP